MFTLTHSDSNADEYRTQILPHVYPDCTSYTTKTDHCDLPTK